MGESGVRRQQWSLQQRILSDDLSDISNLSARAMIETAWAQLFGDAYRTVAAGVGGVVGGYTVMAQAGTLNVVVAPGLALIPETPADADTDSPMVWIQAEAAETIDLTALVDPTFARLVTIEIEANLGVTFETKNEGKIDPTTGAYTVVPFVVKIGGEPTYYATPGAPSATPIVAAGTPGRIPLAIVKLASAAASFADPYAPVLWCRPLLSAMATAPTAVNNGLTALGNVAGGGLSTGASAGGGAFANAGVVDIHETVAELAGLPARAAGPAEFVGGINVRTPDTTNVAALLGTAQPVYAYAVPPPWASDYGSIAPRECRFNNPNAVNLFFAAESVILGEGSTFPSLAYSDPLGNNEGLLRNCIVIFDTEAPLGMVWGPGGTAPGRINNRRGPHPSTANGGAITLLASQDVTWGATQEVSDSVYIGCVSSLGIVPNQFMSQSYQGSGRVRVIDEAVTIGTTYRPTREYTASTGILDAIYPGRYPGMLVGNPEILPDFALHLELSGTLSVGAGPGAARLQIASMYGFGAPQVSPALTGFWTARYAAGDLPSSGFGSEAIAIERNDAGRANIYFQGGVGIASAVVILTGYRDPFLAAR